MTDSQTTGDLIARQLEIYDGIEAKLREVIQRPSWKVRRGKVVLGADGEPVPDPRPARDAQRVLLKLQRDRARLTGQPWPPRTEAGPS